MAKGPLTFQSRFANNGLVILDALGAADLQTAKRLFESISTLCSIDRPEYCRYQKIHNAAEMIATLVEIQTQCGSGLKPILHIEAHGDKDAGIQIGTTGEVVSWPTVLPLFREINKATKNNLGVVMDACFGLYTIVPLRIDEPCPFYFLIGPEKPVPAGYIDDKMAQFYRVLIQTNSLDKAMAEVDEKFKQFHSERFFYIAFAKYMKRVCMGTGGRRRVERLVTEALDDGIPKNRANLRRLRKSAKGFVKDQEAALNRLAMQFLHGRKSVTYEKLQRFVRGDA